MEPALELPGGLSGEVVPFAVVLSGSVEAMVQACLRDMVEGSTGWDRALETPGYCRMSLRDKRQAIYFTTIRCRTRRLRSATAPTTLAFFARVGTSDLHFLHWKGVELRSVAPTPSQNVQNPQSVRR